MSYELHPGMYPLNAGVMLMHVPYMRATYTDFLRCVTDWGHASGILLLAHSEMLERSWCIVHHHSGQLILCPGRFGSSIAILCSVLAPGAEHSIFNPT